MLPSHPNPDLQVGADQRPRWNSAPHRRHGFHNLHRLTRYAASFRAGRVLPLRLATDPDIAQRPDVARLTTSPWFSAMVVARGSTVLFERYAPDFAPDQPHSVMSISKTFLNPVLGLLRDRGQIDMGARAGTHLPWLGAGYRDARIQDIADMNVENAYSEDYSDPNCHAFLHEAATGMRLVDGPEPMARDFLAGIGLAPGRADTRNPSHFCLYKSANTDVLAALAEVASGQPMTRFLADAADAAGLEGALHVATDRTGFPMMNGGICLTARDLARWALLLARRGLGVDGRQFGAPDFFDETLGRGTPMPPPRSHLRYSNQTNTDGTWIGHGGYGGQYMLANLTTGTVAVYLSVLDTEDGYFSSYYPPIIQMLSEIAAL